MVDTTDLKSVDFIGRVGSSPIPSTIHYEIYIIYNCFIFTII